LLQRFEHEAAAVGMQGEDCGRETQIQS